VLRRLVAVLRQQYLGLLALFVALGGVSYAAATGAIDSREIKNNAVRSADVKNRSLLARDFKRGQLPAGPTGAPGPPGEPGAPGSARAYAHVEAESCASNNPGATCAATLAKGVTSIVRHDSAGSYCVTAPGLSPTSTPALATVDVGSDISGAQVTAETDLGNTECGPNGFRVVTLASFPSISNGPSERGDLSFTILIP
jgi:hypothetical protein